MVPHGVPRGPPNFSSKPCRQALASASHCSHCRGTRILLGGAGAGPCVRRATKALVRGFGRGALASVTNCEGRSTHWQAATTRQPTGADDNNRRPELAEGRTLQRKVVAPLDCAQYHSKMPGRQAPLPVKTGGRRTKECFHVLRKKTSSSGNFTAISFENLKTLFVAGFSGGSWARKAGTGIIMMPSATVNTEAEAH